MVNARCHGAPPGTRRTPPHPDTAIITPSTAESRSRDHRPTPHDFDSAWQNGYNQSAPYALIQSAKEPKTPATAGGGKAAEAAALGGTFDCLGSY
jgi:hypothetical protein